MKISTNELLHLKMQAILKENDIPDSELKYIGVKDEEHWYLIAGKHKVPVSMIEGIDED
jgi:hypothetical protein